MSKEKRKRNFKEATESFAAVNSKRCRNKTDALAVRCIASDSSRLHSNLDHVCRIGNDRRLLNFEEKKENDVSRLKQPESREEQSEPLPHLETRRELVEGR